MNPDGSLKYKECFLADKSHVLNKCMAFFNVKFYKELILVPLSLQRSFYSYGKI